MMRSLHAQYRPAEHGFTLLELMVTLGLLSLIVAAIMGGLGTSRRVWQLRGDLEQVSALGAARSLLAARLEDAMPVLQHSAKGVQLAALQGEPDRLRFAAPLVHGLSGGGLVQQTLRLTPPDARGQRNLIIEETAASGVSDAGVSAAPPQQAVLVENVAGLSFRYLGPDPAHAAPTWSADWRRNTALPRLIGLSITFPPGDARQWPELILAPQIGAAARF